MNKMTLNNCLETKFRLRGINRCVFTSISNLDYVYPYHRQYTLVFKDRSKSNLKITKSVLNILLKKYPKLKVLNHVPTSFA